MAYTRLREGENVQETGVHPAVGSLQPSNAPIRSHAALAQTQSHEPRGLSREALEKAALVAGRAIFGGYFVYNGINHFLNSEMLTNYARSKGVPAPALAVQASGLMILLGGASIITGTQPKIGAGLIASFLLGVSPQMHAFWKEREPGTRMQEMVNFTKNMALIGGSLLAAAHPEHRATT
jgi:putative oxidoreductase